MIVKTINTSQCTECDFNDLHYAFAARSDGNQVAFRFEEDSIPEFFNDKTSYTEEEFIAMTKDPSDAWYIA
jgi:hypothetical protein